MIVVKTSLEWDKTYSALSKLGKLKGVKFSYAVAKNIGRIESHLKELELAIKPDQEYEQYDKLRVQIVEKHADKDENGVPIIEGNQYKVDEEKIKQEIDDLNDKYADAIKYRERQMDEFQKMLNEDVGIEIHMIDKESLPDDISVEQMRIVEFMLND